MRFLKKTGFKKKEISIFLANVNLWALLGSLKKISQFGPAVWPAIADIHILFNQFKQYIIYRVTHKE